MNNLRTIGTKMYNLRKIHCLIVTVHKDFCTLHCMRICKELTLPKAVVLGLNLKTQGRAEVMAINFAVSEKKCIYHQNVLQGF